jgi:organic radical activating enzyme
MKSFFPIKTATACQLKWTWSTIFLNDGTTSSCHRVGRHSIALENFDNFHNTPEKLEQRKIMLQGQWPQPLPYMEPSEGCRYCEKIEAAGGQSDRQFHLQVPGLVPPELEQDPTTVEVTPRILEIFMNNTCNLACTYCGPQNSSQIQHENQKFGRFEKNGLVIESKSIDKNQTALYTEKFFSWLESNHLQLRRLHLLGGEPLYQKEFFRCLEFFNNNPNADLEFNIVTNLMYNPEKFESVVQQWKNMVATRKIKRFDITVSLDCWGLEQEYARYGLKLDVIEKNIETLVNNPWIYFNINSTLSPLTIKTFSVLLEKINLWKQRRKINHHFQTVFAPEHHNPDMFGPTFWNQDFEYALSIIAQGDWQENISYKYLQGIQLQIQNSCVNEEKILQLHTHLDELDRRRGTNWRQLFPYLENWRDHVV